jgi:hypothetical protein
MEWWHNLIQADMRTLSKTIFTASLTRLAAGSINVFDGFNLNQYIYV